ASRTVWNAHPAYCITIQDITQRKRMDQALDLERKRMQLVIAQAPVAMAMLDRQLRYITYSEKWLSDYGLEGKDISGKSHLETLPQLAATWKPLCELALAGQAQRGTDDAFP